MNSELLDLELPTEPFPEMEEPLMPSDQWAAWLRRHRLRLIAEGKIDHNEIPDWSGTLFEWKETGSN
jgi:hypothetical protein